MKKIVEIKKLTFKYGDHIIFKKFSLDIEEGSFYTILGSNGSGKSTLARILVGLEPSGAFIRVNGFFLNNVDIDKVRKSVGIVFENPDTQFVTESVEEELAFPLENLNYSKNEIRKRIKDITEKMNITHLIERNPHELSGGEKQLVALASNLIYEPKLLILDEALVMIDGAFRKKIYQILKEYNKKGLTILNITHDNEEALLGSHILILDKGEIVINKKTIEALNDEKAFKKSMMDFPFVIDLSNKLKYYGVVKTIVYDNKKLVNAIWK